MVDRVRVPAAAAPAEELFERAVALLDEVAASDERGAR
jgi:hypothetical protein